MLALSGHEVIEAADATVGLRLWREQRPDVIVTDIALPDMTGFELIGLLRTEGETVPIIAISGTLVVSDLDLVADRLGIALLGKPLLRGSTAIGRGQGTCRQRPVRSFPRGLRRECYLPWHRSSRCSAPIPSMIQTGYSSPSTTGFEAATTTLQAQHATARVLICATQDAWTCGSGSSHKPSARRR